MILVIISYVTEDATEGNREPSVVGLKSDNFHFMLDVDRQCGPHMFLNYIILMEKEPYTHLSM